MLALERRIQPERLSGTDQFIEPFACLGSEKRVDFPLSTVTTFLRIDRPSLKRMNTSTPFSRSGRLAVETGQSLK
jgi:hypothetical protein